MIYRLGLLIALAALVVAAPVGRGTADLDTRARTRDAPLGRGLRRLVVDLGTGDVLIARRADVRRVPASVEKLYTTATALLRLGPGTALQTGVLAATAPDARGVLAGDLYLRGAGDPTLSVTDLDTLALAVATTAAITKVTGRVVGDETLFDTLRGPPSSRGKVSSYVGPLSALSFDRGRTGFVAPTFRPSPPRQPLGPSPARSSATA